MGLVDALDRSNTALRDSLRRYTFSMGSLQPLPCFLTFGLIARPPIMAGIRNESIVCEIACGISATCERLNVYAITLYAQIWLLSD